MALVPGRRRLSPLNLGRSQRGPQLRMVAERREGGLLLDLRVTNHLAPLDPPIHGRRSDQPVPHRHLVVEQLHEIE